MDSHRHGEEGRPQFRSWRFFSVNGEWYFDTREGIQFGPYPNENEAKKALAVFLAQGLRSLNEKMTVNAGVRPGAQDGIDNMVDELLKFFLFRNNFGETVALSWAQRRITELKINRKFISNSAERIEALQYAMDQEYEACQE